MRIDYFGYSKIDYVIYIKLYDIKQGFVVLSFGILYFIDPIVINIYHICFTIIDL